MRDYLSRVVVGTGAALTLLTAVGIPVFGSVLAFGETRPLTQLPWILPVAQSFAVLSGLAIAFLFLGRYLAFGAARAYQTGAIFLANAILGTFYLLSWPGLLGDRGLISQLSNTASWFFLMTFSCLALLVPVNSGVARQVAPSRTVYTSYGLAVVVAVAVGALSLVFEHSLPALVTGLTFTPLNVVWVGVLVLLLAAGSVYSLRRYRQEEDVILGYLSLFLVLMAFGLMYSVLGGKRYDIWWYGSRLVYVLGYLAMLFGLLQEGYELFRRERVRADERAVLLAEIGKLAGIAQRRAGELEAILGSIADAVFVFDAQGAIILGNGASEALLGKNPGDPLGDIESYARALRLQTEEGEPLKIEDMAVSRAIQAGEVERGREETAIHPGTGQRIALLVSAAPLRDEDGRITGAVAVVADITRLQELQERQKEYVSLIGHDLRSPLTSVMGMSQLLQRALEKKGLDQEARMAESVVKGSRRMEAMVRDLVDSARLELGQMETRMEPLGLVSLIFDLVERIGTPDDRRRIRLEAPEVPLPIVGDVSSLDRALTNLITNALKYSEPNTMVTVRMAPRDGMAVVSVIDSGVGIPAEEIDLVFERSFRSRTAGQREGLGLGLYITRLIVERHGGRVWVESEPGRGSAFHIALPRAAHAPHQ